MRPILSLALAFAGLSAAAQAATATVSAAATIDAPSGGIEILSNALLPTVIPFAPQGLGGGASSGQTGAGNAALTVHAESGDTLSMAIPASFLVVRSGGMEGLSVTTTTDSILRLTQGGVVLGSRDFAGGTLSIKVGGLVTLATANAIAPGPYEGLVVVLVQYN